MAAVQGLDFLAPLEPSSATKAVYEIIREKVPTVEDDRHFGPDIEYIYHLAREGNIVKTIEDLMGRMMF